MKWEYFSGQIDADEQRMRADNCPLSVFICVRFLEDVSWKAAFQLNILLHLLLQLDHKMPIGDLDLFDAARKAIPETSLVTEFLHQILVLDIAPPC